MPELGFSIHHGFAARSPSRRGVRNVRDVDQLFNARSRAPVEIYAGLALLGMLLGILAWPDQAAMLMRLALR